MSGSHAFDLRPLQRFALAVLTSALVACGAEAPPPTGVGSLEKAPADLVLTGGRVYTLDWGEPDAEGTPAADAPHSADGWRPDAEAVAVRGDRIIFVGDAAGARAFVGPETDVVELGGATVVPGLVDSHTHVSGLGERAFRVDLVGVSTEEEAVAQVAARAEVTPAGEWILGSGWDEGAWADRYPTMERLSAAVPDHPVLLDSLHGFAAWGNRLAFERAGITRATPDPDGGEILRDASGDPSGVVLNRAGPLLRSAVPEPTADQEQGFLLAGLRQMARDGYVAVHEAGSSRGHVAALQDLEASGELPIRVYAMLSARDAELCREWLDRGPLDGTGGKLAVRSVKAYYDAALGSRGARLLADYADRPGHRGTSGDTYGFDEALVADMMRGGFQVGIHAIGDAGNRETLDFLDSVQGNDPAIRAQRHRIEHAQVVHPDDVPRFAELGVIASMEPPHAVEDMAWAEDRLGPERVRGAYAWRTLRRAEARLTFNSDLAGSDHDIFYGLHAAITRRDANREPAEGWFPEQRMTAEEALRGYTSWSAFAAHWEEHTGVLAPGRWADMTVLDVDPLVLGDTDPGALLEGRILATVVAGRMVHRAAEFR
ncbi:MAG: amidohydrolase [Acidobacteriota bacterium]